MSHYTYSPEELQAVISRIRDRVVNERLPPVDRELIIDEILNDPTTKYSADDDEDREFLNERIDDAVSSGLIKEILVEIGSIHAVYVRPEERTFSLAVTCGDKVRLESLVDIMTGHDKGTALRLGPQL
jgi:hypothetical protein